MACADIKPNILFILVDDLGWKDIACCGSEFYETPHLDKLASQGMQFSEAYASCPVCSPTRASIMTGKYPAVVGITDWIDAGSEIHPARGRLIDVPYLKQLPTSEYSLAKALKDGGYATWHVGKWHLGGEGFLPEDHGFEVNIGGGHNGSPGNGGYFSPWTIDALNDVEVPDGTYLTDYLTDQAIELVRQKGDRPFFLNMCYYSVHTPIQAKEEKIKKYEVKARSMGLAQMQTFAEGDFFPCEHKKQWRIMRRLVQSDPVYAAMIESLDENVGRLLFAIEESGEADNTIVIFTSDNGGLSTAEGSPTCNAPLSEGKGWMYEGGTRVPLFVKWPEMIKPETPCSVPVISTDFYPTLLQAARLELLSSQHVDGESLVPLLIGEESLRRKAIFWHYPHYGNQGSTPGSSVRSGSYKLIEFFEDSRIELYDLQNDPGEKKDLAQEIPERVQDMITTLQLWRQRVEAKIPQANPNWHDVGKSDLALPS